MVVANPQARSPPPAYLSPCIVCPLFRRYAKDAGYFYAYGKERIQMNPEFVRTTISKLLDLFQRQDFPEILAHTIIRRHPDDAIPSQRWSLANRLLMILNGTSDARGYKQWLDVGRHVRKGESAIRIIAPITRRSVKVPETEEDVRSIVVGFVPIAVFPVEATDGQPLPLFDYQPKETPPLWCVAERLGIQVHYRPFGGSYFGCYRPGKDEIELASQDIFVYFHELAHAVHHRIEPLRPGILARAEAVAEITACTLCHIQGVFGYENSAYRYVALYSQGKRPDDVLQFISGTLSEVEKVVLQILATAEEAELEMIPMFPQQPLTPTMKGEVAQ